MGTMIAVRFYFTHISECFAEITKYCDVCQYVNTDTLQEGNKTPHPIPVPLDVWNQIDIDLIGPLKETDIYRYTATDVHYTSKFNEAEQLKGEN